MSCTLWVDESDVFIAAPSRFLDPRDRTPRTHINPT